MTEENDPDAKDIEIIIDGFTGEAKAFVLTHTVLSKEKQRLEVELNYLEMGLRPKPTEVYNSSIHKITFKPNTDLVLIPDPSFIRIGDSDLQLGRLEDIDTVTIKWKMRKKIDVGEAMARWGNPDET